MSMSFNNSASIIFENYRMLKNIKVCNSYLLKTNVIGIFSEALSAEVKSILADETVLVGTGPAVT